MSDHRRNRRGGNLPPVLVGIDGQNHMDMVRHNTIFIYGNHRVMFRDLQNRRFYNGAVFDRFGRQVAAPTFQRIGFLSFTQIVMKYAPGVE